MTGLRHRQDSWKCRHLIVPLFNIKPAGAALRARTCLPSSSRPGQEGKLNSSGEVVNCFLQRRQPTKSSPSLFGHYEFQAAPCQSTVEYGGALWTKALRCGPDYDEYCLNGTFNEGLWMSVRQNNLDNCANRKLSSQQELAVLHCFMSIYIRAAQRQTQDNQDHTGQMLPIVILATPWTLCPSRASSVWLTAKRAEHYRRSSCWWF